MWPRRWCRVAPLLLALMATVPVVQAQSLIIAGDQWCPINCEVDSSRPGIFVELAQQIFAEAGISVEYRNTNWARTLQQVRSGRFNAAIGAGHEDAPDFIYTDTPVALARNCFYTRSDSTWRYAGPESLLAQRLGVINDYSYGATLNAYIQEHRGNPERVQQASGERALALSITKLQRGRLDVLLENTWVVQNLLKRMGKSGQLREAGCREPDVPIYLAFSPRLESSKHYVQIFQRGLERYRADGRLQKLLDAYGVQSP
ncbi:substrate-binding periplasmic protein [Pseudomonas sp. 5P_3.1_Bac2]|uniref:substrate-binding periplasmic protein n=1 Tax=Pseudomonas sp. 5P_3.1_Bac2 TaxID=2971617 RepID=UPI0021C7CAF9|nr:transporter substrate-binding domain-containing protein [Pseudomonas sp. 5P_3.1_Bac2]MCU1716462.1 transporter substrate-binding domain-containing protein [Pseudomonas sp. 5P_3.1_Bac2]